MERIEEIRQEMIKSEEWNLDYHKKKLIKAELALKILAGKRD